MSRPSRGAGPDPRGYCGPQKCCGCDWRVPCTAIAALAIAYVVCPLALAGYWRHRRPAKLVCPETLEVASVRVARLSAMVTEFRAKPRHGAEGRRVLAVARARGLPAALREDPSGHPLSDRTGRSQQEPAGRALLREQADRLRAGAADR